MNRKAFKRMVDRSFGELDRACDATPGASRLLLEAVKAAEDGERAHRRFTRGCPSYRQSVPTAARYFVLHWYCATTEGDRISWEDAATVRSDALYAHGLRVMLRKAGTDPWPTASGFNGDYLEDIAPCR